jgi:hypothetical protein
MPESESENEEEEPIYECLLCGLEILGKVRFPLQIGPDSLGDEDAVFTLSGSGRATADGGLQSPRRWHWVNRP